jgi:hypothetical protein
VCLQRVVDNALWYFERYPVEGEGKQNEQQDGDLIPPAVLPDEAKNILLQACPPP